MVKSLATLLLSVAVSFAVPFQALAQNDSWSGDWVSSGGAMTLDENGSQVSGTFLGGGTFEGVLRDKTIAAKCTRGEEFWTGDIVLGDDGVSFKGERKFSNGRKDSWRGWKKDPRAGEGDVADFSGTWLSSWGTMQLEQKGEKVSGFYTSARWGSLEGSVTGRKLTFNYRKFNFRGQGEIEMSADGKRIFGNETEGRFTEVFGVKPAGFSHHVTPKAGEIVQGIADNGMLYHLRMPDGWTEGQKTDVVVLLHGSNWTTAGMVFITNENWPEIGKKFAIVGIQGESWASWSDIDDLRFNYTYVNWVGRSTYGGYPGTDRESPYLVAEVLDEMEKLYSFGRVFLGGHSQGGYLAYVMHMHFPEKLAGTFPVAGGLIFQAEPEAFDDKKLMAAQRETPMAIVHGKSDNVVDFGMGQAAHNSFMTAGFPKVRLISPNLGHPYDFLPINEAIHYLDMLTTEDKDQLAEYANEQIKIKNWRDVGNAIVRAKEINAGPLFSPIWRQYEEAAKKDAAKLLKDIERNKDNKWVDDYIDYSADFSNADAAKAIMEAFAKLRDEQSEPADELMKQAREAFQSGNRAKGLELYQQIADKFYASSHYRTVRDALKRNR